MTKGAPCKKINQQVIVANKRYTCVKSGNKLIWSAGVLVKTAKQPKVSPTVNPSPTPTSPPISTPSPSQSPNSLPSPSLSPTPTLTPTFTEPVRPTSFTDLLDAAGGISYWAWEKSATALLAAPTPTPEVVQLIGPNTQMMNADPSIAFRLTSRLYSNFVLPKRIYAIYFGQTDVAWAQTEFNKVALHPNGREAANNCVSAETCWGGLSEIDLKGNAILLMALRSPALKDSNHTSGTIESHEYSHAIQGSQFIGTAKEASAYCCTKAYMPWWLVEGQAEFSQAAAVFYSSFADYILERKNVVGGLKGDSTITDAWLETFLKPAASSDWSKYDNWRLYDVGFLASEVLASLKGPEGVMQLFRDVASGKSYEEAFKGIYGFSWSDAVPIMARTISAMIRL
jgi:hypothetical protein